MLATGILMFHVLLLLGQYFIDRKNFTFFNPKILFQVYLIIQVPVVLLLATTFELQGFNSLSINTDSERVLLIGLLSLAAQFSLLVGYYSISRWRFKLHFCNLKVWSKVRANLISGIFFLLGYIAFFTLLGLNGGYSEFMENRESWRSGGMSGQGILLFPATTMIATGALILLITHRDFFATPGRLRWLLALIVITVLPATQLGFRGYVLAPVIQLLFLYHFLVKRLNFFKIVFPLALLAILFTAYGLYREMSFVIKDGYTIEKIIDFVSDNPEMALSVLLRSKGADIISVVIDGISNGVSYAHVFPIFIEAMTIAIPRWIWEDKVKPLSVLFSEEFFGLGGGVSPTIVGESYWHAGVVGILFIPFFVGIVMRIYWNILQSERNNSTTLLLLASIFPAMFLMAESLQSQINSISIITTFIFIVVFLIRIRI